MGKLHRDARIAWLIYTNPIVIDMHEAFPEKVEGLIRRTKGIPDGAKEILLHLLSPDNEDLV